MRTYDYKGTKVTVEKGEYRNGTVALLLNETDGELYAVATVNLCHPLQSDSMAFLDENNLPGIGAWLRKNKIASPLGYKERSGFCQYELYAFHHHA